MDAKTYLEKRIEHYNWDINEARNELNEEQWYDYVRPIRGKVFVLQQELEHYETFKDILYKDEESIPVKWLIEAKEYLDLEDYVDKIQAIIDAWREDNEPSTSD